jgi:hypothetical protein
MIYFLVFYPNINYVYSYTQKIAIQYITVAYKNLKVKKLVFMN